MHEIEYVVRLWIRGNDFDPDTASDLLELDPSATTRAGEMLPNRRNTIAPITTWSYNEKDEDEHWSSLEEGLLSMTALLLPRKKELAQLAAMHEVFIGCGVFKESFDGGPSFSSRLLRELAELGIELWMDIYQSPPINADEGGSRV
jgi:Domain of unknown function (DUF4279)